MGKQGKDEGCVCNPEYKAVIGHYEGGAQKVIDEALEAIDENPDPPPEDDEDDSEPPPEDDEGKPDPPPGPKPKTECPGDPTDLPSEFFLDQTSTDFCKKVMEDVGKPRENYSYDVKGKRLEDKKRRRSTTWVTKRSPPVKTDSYMDFRINLSYKPQDGDCLVDEKDLCKNAYRKLVESNCKFQQEGITPSPVCVGHRVWVTRDHYSV